MVKIAIIPARGGSKRIFRKNMALFDGKPLIHKTIQCALDSHIFDQIIVSTDDLEIAEYSRTLGVMVPDLRSNYFDDAAPVSKVTLYEVERFFRMNNEQPKFVFQLLPTCPFRTVADLESVNHLLREDEDRSIITCNSPMGANLWWAATLETNLKPNFLFPEELKKRSQDLPKTFVPNGAVWASKINILQQYNSFYNPKLVFCEIPWLSGFDIDTPEELEIARTLLF